MWLSLCCEICPTELYSYYLHSVFVVSLFNLGHFQVMVVPATEPFVFHAWLLRKSQFKYGEIIDNHIADRKLQSMRSICCDLWTTKILTKNCKSFLNRGLSKFGFFPDSYCNRYRFNFFKIFSTKIVYPKLCKFWIWENNHCVHILYLCY
jgi:hypothetical protein